jgi:glycosidase
MEKIVIYQVFPRLFGNEKTANIPNGDLEQNGTGKLSAFTPAVLQEIKNMGFTHIWYTGLLRHASQTDYREYGIEPDHPAIVKGKAGSPYAIRDYYDIDPDLADDIPNRMREWEDLVERTHQAGLKVIIDFVPNHVARQYDSKAKPEGVVGLGEKDNVHTSFDANNNFYYIPGQTLDLSGCCSDLENDYHEFPAKVTGNDCFTAFPGKNDWYETVKLNYGVDFLNGKYCHFDPVPATWTQMCDILKFWASKNIDGFRCDMAEMVPVEFWSYAITSVKQMYPSVIFIAEVYNPDLYRHYLWNGRFDYLYNKVGLYDTLRAVICQNQSAKTITSCWQAVDDILPQMLNFLENHDEQRIASDFFAGNPWKAIPAMVVAATLHKNPVLIYAGQELGEKGMDAEGFSGLDGRTSIFDYWSVESLRKWDKPDGEQKSLRNFYSRLLNGCNKSAAIREGKFFDLMYANISNPHFNSDRQFAFMRYAEKELLLIAVNFDEMDTVVEVFIPSDVFHYFEIEETRISSAEDLFSEEKMPVEIKGNSFYSMNLNKHSACIVRFSLKK